MTAVAPGATAGGLVAAFNRSGANGLSGAVGQAIADAGAAIEELARQQVAPTVREHIDLSAVRIHRVDLSFLPTGSIIRTNAEGTRALRLTVGRPITATAELDVDLSTALGLFGDAQVSSPDPVQTLPQTGLRSLVISGRIDVLIDTTVMATVAGLRVSPDGRVDVQGLELTEEARKLVSVFGVNLISLERTIGSLLAALAAFLKVAELAGGFVAASELIRGDRDTLARVVAAAADGSESTVVEPTVVDIATRQLEETLSLEVSALLRRYVEEPMGLTLADLLGREPRLVTPR